jgi:hypothetical protein
VGETGDSETGIQERRSAVSEEGCAGTALTSSGNGACGGRDGAAKTAWERERKGEEQGSSKSSCDDNNGIASSTTLNTD